MTVIVFQKCGGDVPQGLQLVIPDVLALVLGKAEEKERSLLRSIGDDHAKPARSSLAGTGNALFD
ncbi:hypothetical protein RLDS_06935 [Sphingobium lactosutens DS20]|uniref:Uncharacterized protein n=1 Tax=Sphingobium lactosutens DS20 TaxID=1331060 RepID=T0IXC3_9SPHN|nr:hypothetical protein RLDS_06935 [Sphingobium lactosutens DS20]